MRVEDLDLKELLELDLGGEEVQFTRHKALIFDGVSQGLLRKELIETFGERTAQGILTRYGYIHGSRLAATLEKKFEWDSPEDWQKAGARIFAMQGLFKLDPDGPLAFGPEGATWLSSFEAEQHILLKGRSQKPVCWNLCGLLSGYLSASMGKEMYALEDKCIGKGDPVCHVMIKSEDEWGDQVKEDLAVFKRVGINDTLNEVTHKLKLTEKELHRKTMQLTRLSKIEEGPAEIIARSPEMRKMMDLAKTIAAVDSTLLISGESGTGKERVAHFIHEHSAQSEGPFIAVNCGAITETLFDSELFGHVRGAFSGATTDRIGLFEAANGGTLFLDEVGEIPLSVQVKLLRALQEREVRRVGENKSRPIKARIISATNKDLKVEVAEKRFREDLFYRINVFELSVPPLRQRQEDILPLARQLLAEAALRMNRPSVELSAKVADQLFNYSWPGNVRELSNAMERAAAVTKTHQVDVLDLHHRVHMAVPSISTAGKIRKLKEVEEECIWAAMEKTKGNRVKAAELLGIGAATLYRRLKTMKIE